MIICGKNMNNVIVNSSQIDQPLLFLSVENKLSSLDDVTIARPRTENKIHQLYWEQLYQRWQQSLSSLVEQKKKRKMKKKKTSVRGPVRRALDIYLERKEREKEKKIREEEARKKNLSRESPLSHKKKQKNHYGH